MPLIVLQINPMEHTMPTPNVYFHTDAYHAAIDRLEDIARSFDPTAPIDLRSQLIEALGDLSVWPIEIFSGEDAGKIMLAQ